MKELFRIVILLLLTCFMYSNSAYSDQNLNESFAKAVSTKNFTLMEKLLKEGAEINTPADKDGIFPPLTIAASYGDIEVVNFLLSKGANLEGVKSFPNSALFMAIGGNHIAVVKRFLDLGISPNYAWPNRDGGTPLIEAVQLGHLDMVKLLLQRGADVNYTGNGNFSPLYRAIIYDYLVVFKELLNNGACLNKQDKQALSELEWTKVKSNLKYINLLKKNQKCKNTSF